MTTSFLYFPLMFLFCSHLLSISATSSELNEVCKLLDRYDKYVTPQICHSVLESDAKSRAADLDGLGVIAANITAKNATLVAAGLNHLLLNGSLNHEQEEFVRLCISYFTNTTVNTKVAMELIRSKNYRTAEAALFQSSLTTYTCEDVVKGDFDLDDLVWPYIRWFWNVSSVAYALGQYLVDYHHV